MWELTPRSRPSGTEFSTTIPNNKPNINSRRRTRRTSATEAENWSRWTLMENPKGVRVPGWKYPVLESAISYQTSNYAAATGSHLWRRGKPWVRTLGTGVWFCLDSSRTLDKVHGDWLLYNNMYYLVWDVAWFGRVPAWHAQHEFWFPALHTLDSSVCVHSPFKR